MKRLVLITFLTLLAAAAAFPQDEAADTPKPTRPNDRVNLLREIGLQPEQLKAFRRVNQEMRPQVVAAQTRLREANRSLDEAIYSDSVDEALIQSRLKAAQEAQAEVVRLRSMNELAIRKILTPDQLLHFREIRQRFEEDRREIVKRRQQMLKGEADGTQIRPSRRELLRRQRQQLQTKQN